MKNITTRSLLASLALSGICVACGPLDSVELGGTLTQSLTLGESGAVPHRVTSNLTVTGDAILMVEPGARIEVDPGLYIRMDAKGALSAIGTADKPVVFTASDPALGWMGIHFYNSNKTENRLEHVIVEYAGSAKQTHASEAASIALITNQPNPVRASINNTIITKGFANGIELVFNAVVPEFHNNTITDNAGRAAYVTSSVAHSLCGSTIYSGNGQDEVWVKGHPGIDEDVVWDSLDAVYVIDGALQVRRQLTIEAGAQLAFRSDARLEVLGQDAALIAIGSSSDPIVFTGVQATPGFWRGIGFSNATSVDNVLEHVVVEYAGSARLPGAGRAANISVGWTVQSTPSRATIRNSTIRHGDGCGINVESGAPATLEGNTYEGNATGDECLQ